MTFLGLPGLADVHTHFLPPRMQRRVWDHFDQAGPLIGRPWPLHYRDTDEALVDPAVLAAKIRAVKDRCPEVFVNARVDTFWREVEAPG